MKEGLYEKAEEVRRQGVIYVGTQHTLRSIIVPLQIDPKVA